MKNINSKPFIYLIVGFTFCVTLITAYLKNIELININNLIKLFPSVVAYDAFAYLIFTKWLWRNKIFQIWLVPFPDLNGTWQGFIQSNWKIDGKTIDPIPILLCIKQTYNKISCVMLTEEMRSHSYIEGFCIDNENQIRQLCYSYTSRPIITLRERSTPHDGTIILNIIGARTLKLEGEYWTQRQTAGTVKLTFRTKEHLDELPIDMKSHPMSIAKNNISY